MIKRAFKSYFNNHIFVYNDDNESFKHDGSHGRDEGDSGCQGDGTSG